MNKYITKDEYLKAKGVNLEIELQDDDNHSNKVERFIKEVTDWVCDYLVHEYCQNVLNEVVNPNGWDSLPEWRQTFFRKGVIEQIEYILNNGLITQDSGINKELGTIMDYSRVVLGYNAFIKLRLGAFCNIKTGRC